LNPPSSALKFLRWYCRKERLEELEGDLMEMHQLRSLETNNNIKLKALFWKDVIFCLKRYSVNKTQLNMNTALYRSFFKLALRNSWKNKGPIFLNILGLGLALSFCLTIYMLNAYNLEFDSFYKEADKYYRLHSLRKTHNSTGRYELVPLPMLDYLRSNSSNVKNVTTFSYDAAIVKDGYDFIKENGAIVSDNFFEMFDMPLKYGDQSRLKDQNTVFITERMSEKYFKDLFPIDQTMTIYVDEQYKAEVVVGGVVADYPLNSSFQFDILVSQQLYNSLASLDPNNWKKTKRVGMYLETENPEELLNELEDARLLNNEQSTTWQIADFDLMPFIDARVSDHIINYSPGNMRIRPEAVIIFVFMALLILLVACFNFTNTGIALMANRVKEIGIRRTIGSQSRQIFLQFFFEILVISFFALLVAIGMSNFFAEQFFGLYGVKFLLQDISIIRFIPFLIIFLLIVTSISGLLPSLYALRFNAVNILQSKYKLKGLE
jgi:ABC-type antimicrobial peptide transport system permease subunit